MTVKIFGAAIIVTMAASLGICNLQASEQAGPSPLDLHSQALQVMETHCLSCNGPEKQKGDVRLDALETIDPVDRQELFALAQEAVHFGEMPPEDLDLTMQRNRFPQEGAIDRFLRG